MKKLKAESVIFFSQLDEYIFFHALEKNPMIKSNMGQGVNIIIEADEKLADYENLMSLYITFKRYKIDVSQLKSLKNRKNDEWFRKCDMIWSDDIFGIG